MDRQEEGKAFIEKLEALFVNTPQHKSEIDFSQLRDLVRSNPEIAIAAAKAYAANPSKNKSHAQLAIALATAYRAEFDDDSLCRSVERDLKAIGYGDVHLEFKNVTQNVTQQTPKVVVMEIDSQSLNKCEIYALTRILKIGTVASDSQLSLRGRVVLTFPLDNDPRPVWQIPQARNFMGKIFNELPYIVYYLHKDSKLGMGIMLYGCLADPEAFDASGQMDLTHPTVVTPLLLSITATVGIAHILREPKKILLDHVLSIFPDEYAKWLTTEFELNKLIT